MKKRALCFLCVLALLCSLSVFSASAAVCVAGHTWNDWTQITTATCTTPGVSVRACVICGAVETQDEPVLGHIFTCYVANGDGTWTATCTRCGATDTVNELPRLAGDLDGDGAVTDDDAIHLLMYTFFPESYPIADPTICDYDKDDKITDDDAIYLLMFTFFPEEYPLPPIENGTPSQDPEPTIQSALPFSKGLNVNGLETAAYTATDTESVTYYLSQANTFPEIKAKGFDYVRLPVDLRKYYDTSSKKLLTSGDYNIENIDGIINRATDAGLYIILVLYGWSNINPSNNTHKATFQNLWTALAEHYKNYSDKLCFELLDKPQLKGSAVDTLNWVLNATIAEIRKTNPDRWIFYAVGDSGQAWYLSGMNGVTNPDPPKDDKHIAIAAISYMPAKFVRQSEPEEGNQPVRLYEASNGDHTWNIKKIGDFAINNDIPGILSEFSISKYAVAADVRDYMLATLDKCVECGVPMCYWNYCDTTTNFLPARNGWNGEWNETLLTGFGF